MRHLSVCARFAIFAVMEVRAKKALGQHFLTDQKVARSIVDALQCPGPALEIGPGMGVLTQYLLQREDVDLKLVEIDGESVEYLLAHFPGMQGRLLQADFLTLRLEKLFPERFAVIGNFPYNISSQIFFKILDHRERIPEVVCMIQKEVAERIAEAPGSKTYGILSVLLQAWYDIEYLFSVGSGCFAPPPRWNRLSSASGAMADPRSAVTRPCSRPSSRPPSDSGARCSAIPSSRSSPPRRSGRDGPRKRRPPFWNRKFSVSARKNSPSKISSA